MYSFEQSEQLNLFLLSLGAGFVLGVVYDILRTIRLTISKGKAIILTYLPGIISSNLLYT